LVAAIRRGYREVDTPEILSPAYPSELLKISGLTYKSPGSTALGELLAIA
jgi:hypothetical protein